MSLTTIMTSVYDRIKAATWSVPVFYNNIEYDGPTESPPTGNHLLPYVLPSRPRTIGLNSLSQEIGLIQFNIMVEKGKGEIVSARIVDEILAVFPRNLQLDGLRIDRAPGADVAFYKGAWYITPVTIEYQNLEG